MLEVNLSCNFFKGSFDHDGLLLCPSLNLTVPYVRTENTLGCEGPLYCNEQ